MGVPLLLKRANVVATLLTLGLVVFPSCGVWDFFSAYFNTYYNAQTVYGQAVSEVWAMPELRESGRNMLAIIPIPNSARTKFSAVIEKCSKLLQYHPESNLVDDALLMIGSSYFYQGEFQQADRKFRELLDGYPESSLVPETRVLLSYALFKIRDREAAEELAMSIYDEGTAKDDDRLIADAALVLAEIALDAKDTTRARAMLDEVGMRASDPDLRASAYLRSAGLAAEEGDYAAAETAYKQARSLSRTFIGEFKGLFGAAKMVAKQGDTEVALDRLIDLRDNMNYREYFGEIDVEIGHVYRDRGDIEEAIEQYRYVDTAYARGEAAVNSAYALGTLYEKQLLLFDSARVAYERGRTGPPSAKNHPVVARRAEYLSRYLQYGREVVKLDSTLHALLHPPDSVLAAQDTARVLPDSLRADSTALARADSLKPKAPAPPPVHPDTIRVRLAKAIDDLAGVLYANMELPDSARFWYQRLVREFPSSHAAPRALYVLARIEGSDTTASHAVSDSLYRLIIERHPESVFAAEARRLLGLPPLEKTVDPAEESYARAVRLLQDGKAKPALDTLNRILKRHPESPAAVRALYAAGWLYENETQGLDSAAALYERLLARAPSSPYAQKVQPRVAEVQNVRRIALEKARADSLAAAKAAAPDSLAPAAPTDVQIEEQLLEERRRAAQKPGGKEPPKTTRPRETPEEKPVD